MLTAPPHPGRRGRAGLRRPPYVLRRTRRPLQPAGAPAPDRGVGPEPSWPWRFPAVPRHRSSRCGRSPKPARAFVPARPELPAGPDRAHAHRLAPGPASPRSPPGPPTDLPATRPSGWPSTPRNHAGILACPRHRHRRRTAVPAATAPPRLRDLHLRLHRPAQGRRRHPRAVSANFAAEQAAALRPRHRHSGTAFRLTELRRLDPRTLLALAAAATPGRRPAARLRRRRTRRADPHRAGHPRRSSPPRPGHHRPRGLDALRVLVVGGEAVPADWWRSWAPGRHALRTTATAPPRPPS